MIGWMEGVSFLLLLGVAMPLKYVVGIAVAKAPDLDAARHLGEFLGTILGAEDALFLRAFEALGVAEREYRSAEPLPTTAAFSDFLIRLAYGGSFRETCTALFVAEAVYLDWAERLRAEGASPGVAAYQEWIDIHSEEALGPFVSFLRGIVDEGPDDDATLAGLETAFETSLRYEIRFWEMGYHGESWQ